MSSVSSQFVMSQRIMQNATAKS